MTLKPSDVIWVALAIMWMYSALGVTVVTCVWVWS
jgi:hypothetical protein